MNNESPRQPNDSLPVIACDLSALTVEQRRERATLAEALRAGVLEATELPTGYAFHLDWNATTERQVADLIALERLCCSFLSFATRIDAENERLILEISGGEEVRDFIASQFVIEGRLTPKEAP
jgi:hypothetical protein